MNGALALLLLVGLALLMAAGAGATLAGIVRSTRRNLPPDELDRKARAGFWIGFMLGVAVELLLLGLCVSAFRQSG